MRFGEVPIIVIRPPSSDPNASGMSSFDGARPTRAATMTIIERSQEIGMLRSVGFTQSYIKTLFLREMLALTALSVAVGGVVVCCGGGGVWACVQAGWLSWATGNIIHRGDPLIIRYTVFTAC